eukprot:COSAG05_NODE_4146_length_1653_cov_1.480051_1_plen_199_part_00
MHHATPMSTWRRLLADSSTARLLALLWLYRSLNAIAVRTYFNPDEYWQSLEVAHKMAFGRGHLTWEWAPDTQLRGYTHPLIFAALYRLLSLTGLDRSVSVMVYAPRILQALCAALCDLAVYQLAMRWFDEHTAQNALVCSLVAWFNFYCSVRPFSNCAETTLTAVSLVWWPFKGASPPAPQMRLAALLLAATSICFRP